MELLMRLFAFGSLIIVSIFALLAHAERLPHPPGPTYGGFIPGDWEHRSNDQAGPGCGQ